MSKISLEDAVKTMIKGHLKNNVFTCLPAVITDVSEFGLSNTINVKPTINRLYDDFTILGFPEIVSVPVLCPTGGGGGLSFPLAVGDSVLLIFSSVSIDEWMASNGVDSVTPKDGRCFSLTDAFALVGLHTTRSTQKPNINDVELKFSGSSIKLKPDGDLEIVTANNLVATVAGEATVTAQGNINLNSSADINITASGNVNISGTTINLN